MKMSNVLIVFEKKDEPQYQSIIELIKEYFIDLSYTVEEFCVADNATKAECRGKLSETKCDYICTLDMPCIELTTLLGDTIYNILPAKQIHIIIDTKKLRVYKKTDFALNLFVFLPDSEKHHEEEYTHIPNLALYPTFELKNEQGEEADRKTVWHIIESVRRECETT